MNPIKSNIVGLLPIAVFVALITLTGIFTGSFSSMPVLVAFMIAAGIALLLNPKNEKISITDKLNLFCKEGGEQTIILLVIIFLLAGAFYAIAGAIGSVESTVNLGLSLIPADYLMAGLFLIACFISFSIGTSMGTVIALTPIGIAISSQTGIPLELALGTVIGGGMFGDNLSFISDTTIAAVRTQGTELRDKFKVNFMIAVPAMIITCILITYLSKIKGSAEIEYGDYELILLLPYLTVVVTAMLGLNVIAVLALGIGIGSIIGLYRGTFDIVGMFAKIQEGMGWMEDLGIIAIIIGGIVGLMTRYGGIQWILENITKRVKTRRGAEFGIATLVSVIDVATANNTISIVAAGPIAKNLADQYQIDPRRSASILDIFSSGFQGLVPYGGQYLAVSGLASVSPIVIIPYAFYPMLLLFMGVLAIIFGIPPFACKPLVHKSLEVK